MDAQEIAESIDIEMSFPLVRQRQKKRQHDYECFDEREEEHEKLLKIHFFFALADASPDFLDERFWTSDQKTLGTFRLSFEY